MESQSLKLFKTKDGVLGYKVCPEWLKNAYRLGVNYVCTLCHKHEDIVGMLQPHRLTRGTHRGLYTVWSLKKKGSNVKLVCDSCHKILHGNEYNKTSHSY